MHPHPHMIHTTNLIPKLTLIFLMIPLVSTAVAAIQPESENKHLSVTAQTSSLAVPGQSGILILELTVDEHWHTYWPGINDTGYGLSVDIPPADSLTFGEPFFPTPTRHVSPGDILDHIYEGTFQVLVPYTVSKDAVPGSRIPVGAFINALVCNDVCIPESDGISLMLAVVNPSDRNFTRQEALDAFSAKPVMPPNADVRWDDDAAHLKLPNATRYTFFPDNNCTQPADLITQGDTESNSLTINFDRQYEDDPTAPARLSGRLRAKINNEWRDFDIDYIQPTPTEKSP